MNFILGIIIGMVVGGLIVWFLKPSKNQKSAMKIEDTKDSNPKVEERKENLEKLEKFISEKSNTDKITNDEVQKLLKISDATSTRYLQEMEDKGLIRQVGEIGYKVFYQKN